VLEELKSLVLKSHLLFEELLIEVCVCACEHVMCLCVRVSACCVYVCVSMLCVWVCISPISISV